MRTNVPYIVEGEILQVQEFVKGSRKYLRYICKVSMPDGTISILPNCSQSTMFGGIDDYLQFRSRTSKDAGVDTQTNKSDEKNAAQIGDRVYIAFVGGNIQKPVIIGYAQHPNQTYEFEDEDPSSSDFQPNLIFKYLGVKVTVDEKGQLRVIHRGAPEIDYSPRSTGLLGAASAAAGALSSAESSGGPGVDKPNPAVTPQDATEITLFEFLDGGVFRVRDAEGQIIELDRTQPRIYISNNDLKSTQDPGDSGVSGNELSTNSTDAEYVLLDKSNKWLILNARSVAQIYSKDKRKDVTEGDHSHKVGGDSTWTIDGDETIKISGNKAETVEGNIDLDSTGDFEVEAGGDVSLETDGGAELHLSGGTVALGNGTVELLDLFNQALTQLINTLTDIQSLTVIGNLGYSSSPPVNSPAFAQLQVSVTQIQTLLGQIKGSISPGT